jgi:hypothetical protein
MLRYATFGGFHRTVDILLLISLPCYFCSVLTPIFGPKMHAGSAGIQTEKLDHLRVAVAKDSPMWETLDICIKVVDTSSLELLIPRLAQMVRSGVGLNTRLASVLM